MMRGDVRSHSDRSEGLMIFISQFALLRIRLTELEKTVHFYAACMLLILPAINPLIRIPKLFQCKAIG